MKNKNKKAFTLIEVMVTLAIFSVVVVLLSSILIQGQRILSKIDNRTVIQGEIRTALFKIQSEAQNSSEVTVNNKFGKFDGDKWLLDNTDNKARELVRFSKDGEDTAKLYVEVNDGNKHQLIEFSIDKTTNEILDNSTNVLINEINGNDANAISINVEDINDSNGKKVNELITINCSNIVKGEDINESDYLISFTNKNENIINIEIGSGAGSSTGSGSSNDNNSGSGSNGVTGGTVDNSWNYNWKSDNIDIRLISVNSWGNQQWPQESWKIEIENKGIQDITDWELTLTLNAGATLNAYNCKVEKNENKYKISSSDFKKNVISVNSYIQVADGNIYGQKIENVNIELKYKKITKPKNEVIKLENGVKICLYNYEELQVNGLSRGRWYISLENCGESDINKWEMTFDKEKPIKAVSSGLIYNIKDKIYNNINNSIKVGQKIYIYFDTESGVINRNISNVSFKVLN